MTHLLDTDHMSILEQPGTADHATLSGHLAAHGPTDVGVPVVGIHEQFRGAHARINAARSAAQVVAGYELLGRVVQVCVRFPLVPFDPAAAALFAGLVARGVRVKTMDLRIAAIALANNLTLATRNTADFARVPGLRLVDWTK